MHHFPSSHSTDMTTKTSPARKRPFAAPSPAAFEAMTLRQRALCFGRFLRSKPKGETYDYGAINGCALAQFAQAIWRTPEARGAAREVRSGPTAKHVQVLPTEGSLSYSLHSLSLTSTFGGASRRYDKALRSTPKSAFTT